MKHNRKELLRMREAFNKTWDRVKDSPKEARFNMERFAYHLFQTGYQTAMNDLLRPSREE